MISLIVAYTKKDQVIGCNGKIPWQISKEQKRFKELTTGKVIIMGRRTFEEIGQPLPNRITIVVSNTKKFVGDNCHTARSLKEAIDIANGKDIFIAGGSRIYKESISLVERMYITEIEADFYGDTFFPKFSEKNFVKIINQKFHGKIPYTYLTYIKKK